MNISNDLSSESNKGNLELSSNNLPNLIGISGTFASGKDSLAKILVENYGFTHASTSDMVRAAAQERHGNIERPTLRKVGVELRNESGAGVLVERALKLTLPLVVSGIRTTGEVCLLKKAGGVMVFIDADQKIRYDRMKARQRDSESELIFDEFRSKEQKEVSGAKTDADQNIAAVREESDLYLENNGTHDEFIASAISRLVEFKNQNNDK